MKLSSDQTDAITQWNSLGMNIHDNTLRHFVPSWFSNMRSLIKLGLTIQGVKDLIDSLGAVNETFVVLGSGPSAQDICHRLPPNQAILCSPSALGALAREGRKPAALIVADSNPALFDNYVRQFPGAKDLKVALPVTAAPTWYSGEIIPRENLYFYLPYMDYMGSTDLAYNGVLKALFPDVPHFITMAGSVIITAWTIADQACGESLSKRVYVALDASWPVGGPYHTPPFGKESVLEWGKRDLPTIEIGGRESNHVTIGDAIQLFNVLHQRMRDYEFTRGRYALISEASKLYLATSPSTLIPIVAPETTDAVGYPCVGEPDWAYTVLLGLVALSNRLHDRLRDELVEKIIRDWREKPEVQNVVDVPRRDYDLVVKAVHAVEPEVKFKFNGEEIPS